MVLKPSPEVLTQAAKIANRRMQEEVLPMLGGLHPLGRLWKPLREDVSGDGYAMKLWVQDKLALQVLKTPMLLSRTENIVWESLHEAVMFNEKTQTAFVTDILDYLMSSDG